MEFEYSFQRFDPVVHVKASGREVDASPKITREVCLAVKGLSISQARSLLEDVQQKKRAISIRRFKKKSGHSGSVQGFFAAAYPVKAARMVLEVLSNLEANAEFKGFDAEKLKIIHAACSSGRKIRASKPRALGRSSPSYRTLVHIEMVGSEV